MIAARPPFFILTRAPVARRIAREKSGSWPTSSTSPRPGRPTAAGVEVAAAQRLVSSASTPSAAAGDPRRVAGADLGARQAGVDAGAERRERLPGGLRLALALLGQPARRVVGGVVLGVAVAQQPDHGPADRLAVCGDGRGGGIWAGLR